MKVKRERFGHGTLARHFFRNPDEIENELVRIQARAGAAYNAWLRRPGAPQSHGLDAEGEWERSMEQWNQASDKLWEEYIGWKHFADALEWLFLDPMLCPECGGEPVRFCCVPEFVPPRPKPAAPSIIPVRTNGGRRFPTCEKCGVGGTTPLYRANPVGEVPARWRCEPCYDQTIDPQTRELMDALSGKGATQK